MQRATRKAWLAFGLLCFALSSLAAELVYLDTPQGEARLVQAERRHQFFAVLPYLEAQENLAFCGPASIAATLNSLGVTRPAVSTLGPYPFFTQDNVFNAATEAIKRREAVAAGGMTLEQLAAFLNALGVQAEARHADTLDAAQLRTLLDTTLADPGRRLIVNYNRKLLDQAGGGHQSPLAAYDRDSDSALLLDVAKFKYPPVWVKLTDLLAAMQSVDSDSGKSRGLVVVSTGSKMPRPVP